MKYSITIRKNARKFIEKQDRATQTRILRAISLLPDQGDIKRLKGMNGLYRLRIGDFRILYVVEHTFKIISVENVDNRGDIYK